MKKSRAEWTKAEIAELQKRAASEWCEAKESDIHGRGVFASKLIPHETKIIEYVGEFIDKEESEKRAIELINRSFETGEAGVYMFTLDDDWDIDGDLEWNTARLINHSCDPNCETWIEGDHIFVYALRDIQEGEELTFNYGFEADTYEDHPCRCGAERCFGYIVAEEEWEQAAELILKAQNEG